MKPTRLSLLVPTRQRSDLLLPRFWASLQATVADWSALEVVHRVDDDDEATVEFLSRLSERPVLVRGPRPEGGYQRLAQLYNEMARQATGDLLMCGNDDMIFRTPGWVELYLRAARRFKNGIFDLGCYTYPTAAVPFSVVSRQAVDTMGFINDERLIYSDIFLRDVMARFGRVWMLPHVVIEHTAPTENVEAMQVKQALHADARAYWTHHYRCVNEAVGRLRAS